MNWENIIFSKEHEKEFLKIIDNLIYDINIFIKKGEYEDVEQVLNCLEKTIKLVNSLKFTENEEKTKIKHHF